VTALQFADTPDACSPAKHRVSRVRDRRVHTAARWSQYQHGSGLTQPSLQTALLDLVREPFSDQPCPASANQCALPCRQRAGAVASAGSIRLSLERRHVIADLVPLSRAAAKRDDDREKQSETARCSEKSRPPGRGAHGSANQWQPSTTSKDCIPFCQPKVMSPVHVPCWNESPEHSANARAF
jgi:hypothetical protein